MIVYDLECRANGHRFEGWFGSSDDYDVQLGRGLVSCPQCGSDDVLKAPMAPNLTRKGNQIAVQAPTAPVGASTVVAAASPVTPGAASPATLPARLPPEAAAMMQAFVRMQAEALKTSSWVGNEFATNARAMHYGEKDQAPIHGQATPKQAHDLLEEGIEIVPILFPMAPPGHVN